jgi:hypothetical protein
MHAKGTFVVQLHPEPPYATEGGITLGRVTLDKTFSGELVATSRGDMLSARGPVANSAGYVAIERVTGTLGGKAGTFVLQHNGIMDRGGGSLTVTVVPDTGTGELAGLRGKMAIEIVDKQHRYELEYEIT